MSEEKLRGTAQEKALSEQLEAHAKELNHLYRDKLKEATEGEAFFQYQDLIVQALYRFIDTCKKYKLLTDFDPEKTFSETYYPALAKIVAGIADGLEKENIKKSLDIILSVIVDAEKSGLVTFSGRDPSPKHDLGQAYATTHQHIATAAQAQDKLMEAVTGLIDMVSEYPKPSPRILKDNLLKLKIELDSILPTVWEYLQTPLEINYEKEKKSLVTPPARKPIVFTGDTAFETQIILNELLKNLENLSSKLAENPEDQELETEILHQIENFIKEVHSRCKNQLSECLISLEQTLNESTKQHLSIFKKLHLVIISQFLADISSTNAKEKKSLSSEETLGNRKERIQEILLEFYKLLEKISTHTKLQSISASQAKSEYETVTKAAETLEEAYNQLSTALSRLIDQCRDYLHYLAETPENQSKQYSDMDVQKKFAHLERTLRSQSEQINKLEQDLKAEKDSNRQLQSRIADTQTGLSEAAVAYQATITQNDALREYFHMVQLELEQQLLVARLKATGEFTQEESNGSKVTTAVISSIPVVGDIASLAKLGVDSLTSLSENHDNIRITKWAAWMGLNRNAIKELAIGLTKANEAEIIKLQTSETKEKKNTYSFSKLAGQARGTIEKLERGEELTTAEKLAKEHVEKILRFMADGRIDISKAVGGDEQSRNNIAKILSIFGTGSKSEKLELGVDGALHEKMTIKEDHYHKKEEPTSKNEIPHQSLTPLPFASTPTLMATEPTKAELAQLITEPSFAVNIPSHSGEHSPTSPLGGINTSNFYFQGSGHSSGKSHVYLPSSSSLSFFSTLPEAPKGLSTPSTSATTNYDSPLQPPKNQKSDKKPESTATKAESRKPKANMLARLFSSRKITPTIATPSTPGVYSSTPTKSSGS